MAPDSTMCAANSATDRVPAAGLKSNLSAGIFSNSAITPSRAYRQPSSASSNNVDAIWDSRIPQQPVVKSRNSDRRGNCALRIGQHHLRTRSGIRPRDVVSGRVTIPHVSPFLLAAVEEAEHGRAEGGIPIGAVLVYRDRIIGRGHNR